MKLSRQSKLLCGVAAVALIAAGSGWYAGAKLKSPADAAASRGAPTASRITVPVEQRVLSSSVVFRGSVTYSEPTAVSLAGSVGGATDAQALVTTAPQAGIALTEGDVVMEVAGRPVFALIGQQPTYRAMTPGAKGADVEQLESSLKRLGFNPGVVDTNFDNATEAAVDAWYASKGYASQGPTPAQRTELRDARTANASAQEQLQTAQREYDTARLGVTGSALVELQNASKSASAAVNTAIAQAALDNSTAQSDVALKTQARATAITERDSAAAAYDSASQPGAINPDTGAPYTALQLAALSSQVTAKASAIGVAEAALTESQKSVTLIAQRGVNAVDDARNALRLAELRLQEALQPKDLSSASTTLNTTRTAASRAATDLSQLENQVGTLVPAGEVLFFPSLPVRINDVSVKRGTAVAAPFMTVSGSDLIVDAKVATADAKSLRAGMSVTIEDVDLGRKLEGSITQVADKPGTKNVGDGNVYVAVTPIDVVAAKELVGSSVRITAAIQSTDGKEVLAVPVAAVSATADGSSRVEVERSPSADTEFVEVAVGLSAQGYVQVTPSDPDRLKVNDRVVVGKK
jgi:hypothetical protein